MLRHSREMTRHHRERIINKRYHTWWMREIYDRAEAETVVYGPPWKSKGYLNKLSMHHHKCDLCHQSYKRPAPGQDKFVQEYENE